VNLARGLNQYVNFSLECSIVIFGEFGFQMTTLFVVSFKVNVSRNLHQQHLSFIEILMKVNTYIHNPIKTEL